MLGIPEAYENLFDDAVRIFQGEGKIVVTEAKLNAFARDTATIPVSNAERLRQLAIALENESFANEWGGLEAIYRAAAQADPNDAEVYISWGLSALEWMESYMTSDMADRLTIATQAEKAFTSALALEPQDTLAAYGFGNLFYHHPTRKDDEVAYLTQAINWYEKALAGDRDNVMAQLYLAHCHHDLAYLSHTNEKLWLKAAAAYARVAQTKLASDWPLWRAVKCREQLAVCYIRGGQETIGKKLLASFLDEIEAFVPDESGDHEAIINFNELVDVVRKKLNDTSLLQRTRAQVKRFRLEFLYPELFAQ